MTTEPDAEARAIRGAGTAEISWQSWPGLDQLPCVSAAQLVPRGSRALILAPHPDDELLGCGGLIRLLAEEGRDVQVLAVTDGGASHPDSTIWPAARLKAARAAESADALRRLGATNVRLLRLGLDDGQVAAQGARLADALNLVLRANDVLVATWRMDGHPDHEAVGVVAAAAVARRGATLLEMPIWMWHWAEAGDPRIPWERACRLPLGSAVHAAKRDAAEAYCSQLEPDPSTGCDPIVPKSALARVLRDYEVYFR